MGFELNGQHTKKLGLVVETINKPLLPSLKQNMVDIPGKDGTYDFSDGTLEDKIIELECAFTFKTFIDLREKVHQIAAFLYCNTYSQLVFDDEPNIYYLVKINNKLDLERTGRIAKFNLQFRCKPLAYSRVAKSIEAISTGDITINVENVGTYNTPTVIYLTANANCLYVTINHELGIFEWGDKLGGAGAGNMLRNGDILKIDSEFMEVTNNSRPALYVQSGNFIELLEGNNNIRITGFSGKIKIEYRERWL